jgi:FKBP-type peptidyl-prolyl cis-trans isomerase (trigger factor)
MADIFEREGLCVSDAEVEAEMAEALRDFERNEQQVDRQRLREQVIEVIKVRPGSE